MEFVENPLKPTLVESLTLSRIDSKSMQKIARAHVKSIRCVWHSVSFCHSISCEWSLKYPAESFSVESLTRSQTDSRCMPKWVGMHMKSIRGICYSVSFRDSISYVYISRRNPFWRKVYRRVGWIRNACQNAIWCMSSPFEVFGTQFISCVDFTYMEFAAPVRIRFWGKFNTDSDGFNACQMR